MKKLREKLKSHPHIITVLLVVMLIFGNSFKLTQADTPATGPVPQPIFKDTSGATDQRDNVCVPAMSDFAAKELTDFRNFLDTNFQNKSSTTSLTNIAIDKYRELRAELYTAYNRYFPNTGSSIISAIVQPGLCRQVVEQTLSDARILLKNHALQTSSVKKATALLEKYQQINAQLADLYQKVVYIKSYLDTFSGKLGCYPKTGCVKG